MSETPTASALVLILLGKRSKGGRTNADLRDCGSQLASRVEAVVALAEESRRKAVAGDGYGLLHAHEVLALLDGVKP